MTAPRGTASRTLSSPRPGRPPVSAAPEEHSLPHICCLRVIEYWPNQTPKITDISVLDPGGQKWPKQIEKSSLYRAEGFSCSLDVLCGGLGIRKQHF